MNAMAQLDESDLASPYAAAMAGETLYIDGGNYILT
jgi:enoyl-[acyl-carrier-protein] reductase (NADH)